MMSVIDTVKRGMELAVKGSGKSPTENGGHLTGGEGKDAQFARTCEEPLNGEVATKDNIVTILNLGNGIKASQVHGGPFPGREFWSYNQDPVIEAFPDDFWS